MLFRKLIRTMGLYKAQFISMIIMIALGIGVFTGFNMEWYTLDVNVNQALEESGFADFRLVNEKGFSAEDRDKIAGIDGVKRVTRFLSVNTSVKDKGVDVLALTVTENIEVSGFYLMEGDKYDPESETAIWVSDKYAGENGFKVGDKITLKYKDSEFGFEIRGLVKSSEYLICVPDSTQLMPDFDTYGYGYITPKALEKVFGAEFYTQINVHSDMEKSDFIKAADKALGITSLVLSKDDTVSYSEAQGEIEEGQTMGNILPVLFLAIAILTMVTTMHRLTASEKTQIGTFKALGFKDKKIVRHYTSFALFIGVVGTVLGIGLGYFLGWFIMNPNGAMGTYIDMRSWTLYMPWFCWIVLAVIILFLVLIGYLSVKSMLKGTAADALRPYSPKKMKRMRIEERKFFKRLGFGTKWNLRDTLRHKSRTFMTLFGIVGCMVLLIGCFGMNDTLNAFVDSFYEKAINYELKINLDTENITNEHALEIAEKYQGDWCASMSVQIGEDPYGVEIYDTPHDKVRFIDDAMETTTLGDDGAYICERIADELDLKEGSSLTFSPFGSDKSYTVTIAGVTRAMAKTVQMTRAYAEKAGIDYIISTVYTDSIDIDSDPMILNTQTRSAIIESFDVFMELMVTMVAMLVAAAVILGIVVLYNLGIMSYTERYREMATLKVIGFKDKKIGSLLISQNLWMTVIGVMIGIPIGYGVLDYLLTALASEYEMVLVIKPLTYVVSTALTFGVSLLVGLMIARKNKYINMVEALKCAE